MMWLFMISVEQNNYSIILPDFELYENWEMYSLASAIVEGTFKYFKIERIVKNRGRKPLNLLNMTKLLFFASIDKIESSIVIRNEAISNLFYRVFL